MRNNGTVNFLVQGHNDERKLLCYDCLKDFAEIVQETSEYVNSNDAENSFEPTINEDKVAGQNQKATPSKLKRCLDKFIIGQEKAKRALTTLIYNHIMMIKAKENGEPGAENLSKSNAIMIGPSGCGKSELIKRISQYLNVPLVIADITSYSSTGFVGRDLECILRDLVEAADGDIERAEKGIVYIDELDKCSRKGESPSTSADPSHEDLQHGLLKLIEGSEVEVAEKGSRMHPSAPSFKINTENILFIVGGAFEGIEKIIARRQRSTTSSIGFSSKMQLNDEKAYNEYIDDITTEDLKKYGLMPELIGRLPLIVTLHTLNEDALVRILTEPKNALVKQYQAKFEMHGIALEFSEEALRAIAKQAIARKTGARSLRGIMENLLADTMYEIPDEVEDNVGYIIDVNDNKEIEIQRICFAEEEIG